MYSSQIEKTKEYEIRSSQCSSCIHFFPCTSSSELDPEGLILLPLPKPESKQCEGSSFTCLTQLCF